MFAISRLCVRLPLSFFSFSRDLQNYMFKYSFSFYSNAAQTFFKPKNDIASGCKLYSVKTESCSSTG